MAQPGPVFNRLHQFSADALPSQVFGDHNFFDPCDAPVGEKRLVIESQDVANENALLLGHTEAGRRIDEHLGECRAEGGLGDRERGGETSGQGADGGLVVGRWRANDDRARRIRFIARRFVSGVSDFDIPR
jgi:hypothetical protein